MTKCKKNHYLPKSYLEGFLNKEEEPIWVYNLEKRKKGVHKKGLMNIGLKNHLHSNIDRITAKKIPNFELEKRLSSIEVKIPRLISNIEKICFNKGMIKDTDKNFLIEFLLLQMKRSPSFIFRHEKRVSEEYDSKIIPFIKDIRPDALEFFQEKGSKKAFAKSVALKMIEEPFIETEKKLKSMGFCLIYTKNTNLNFITSDNPVVSKGSIGNNNGEIFIPLSKNLVLLLTTRFKNGKLFELKSHKSLKIINRGIAGNSENLILGNNENLIKSLLKFQGKFNENQRRLFDTIENINFKLV